MSEPTLNQLDGDTTGREPGLALCRGVARAFRELGFSPLFEVTLPNGRRADVLALDGAGQILLVEVKASVTDFRSDGKWPEYLEFCDFFYFAVDSGFPRKMIPTGAGLMIADAYGAVIEREPEPRPALAPARRKALLLRFAHLAAGRLMGLVDPARGQGPAF